MFLNEKSFFFFMFVDIKVANNLLCYIFQSFYTDVRGLLRPCKRGINLNAEQFNALVGVMEALQRESTLLQDKMKTAPGEEGDATVTESFSEQPSLSSGAGAKRPWSLKRVIEGVKRLTPSPAATTGAAITSTLESGQSKDAEHLMSAVLGKPQNYWAPPASVSSATGVGITSMLESGQSKEAEHLMSTVLGKPQNYWSPTASVSSTTGGAITSMLESGQSKEVKPQRFLADVSYGYSPRYNLN